MKKRVVLLTGNELRHEFFRRFLGTSSDIIVAKSFCENGSPLKVLIGKNEIDLRSQHLKKREVSEKDFFEVFCERTRDDSNPIIIDRGQVNNEKIAAEIINSKPDILISYGCSIIKNELLLETFKGKFINIHLGLSPYYRGSGTNFWPLVNNQFQLVGTTFMHIDRGIDTGEIIHQVRAKIFRGDTPHQIGNRLIKDSFSVLEKLIQNFDFLEKIPSDFFTVKEEKLFRNKDFSDDAVMQLYRNFDNQAVTKYLSEEERLCKDFPIFENPTMYPL
ncbi:formyltransferase family protein [Algoriphagus sp. NG3]|uniref:formyltransferase family protein n=1 Tax=Algoriphagus sp. NG3 TaxID=3097546 RepID=UPI002A829EF9|nr:formyltransferase family protein [Algoriphagus sp. NG3]WPR77791.1 formyltransferase family protein [Algoriphagus sp. NG3]